MLKWVNCFQQAVMRNFFNKAITEKQQQKFKKVKCVYVLKTKFKAKFFVWQWQTVTRDASAPTILAVIG